MLDMPYNVEIKVKDANSNCMKLLHGIVQMSKRCKKDPVQATLAWQASRRNLDKKRDPFTKENFFRREKLSETFGDKIEAHQRNNISGGSLKNFLIACAPNKDDDNSNKLKTSATQDVQIPVPNNRSKDNDDFTELDSSSTSSQSVKLATANTVHSVCMSCGNVENLQTRKDGSMDVHYSIHELLNMPKILEMLNEVAINDGRWIAQPAPRLPQGLAKTWKK